MIQVHPLDRGPQLLDPNHIELIDDGEPTVITLTGGARLEVSDRPEDLARRVRLHRASELAAAGGPPGPDRRHRNRPAGLRDLPDYL